MNEQEQNIIRFFTQCPNIILYGLPDVAIQDKWALLVLVGTCWDRSRGNNTIKYLEGPYKLSLREIERLTGIKHNALRKTEGKNPREGVLDRLQSLGYITVFQGKSINEITGKKERSQTYLYIHLEKLWYDNLAFSERWRMPANKLVDTDTFTTTEESTVHPVTNTVHPVTNTVHPMTNTVHPMTNTVHHVTSDGHSVNKSGHVVNHTVHEASTKLGVIQSNTNNTFKDESNTDRSNKDPTKGESNKGPSPEVEVAANVAHTHASFLNYLSPEELEEIVLLAKAHLEQVPDKHTVDASTPTSVAETGSPIQAQPQPDRKEKSGQNRSHQTSTTRDIALTPQGQHILNLYDEFKGRKAIRNAPTLLAANKLGEVVSSDEDFLQVLKAIANDPFLKQKQVRTDLDFVYRKYDGFLDIVEHARGRRPPGASTTQTDYNEVAGMTDEQRAAYKHQQQEKMKQVQPPGIDRATLMKLKPEERIAVLKKMREQPIPV